MGRGTTVTDHNLFYYPYASFTDAQLPLLKAVALFFDKLYILDPEKATGGTIGLGDRAKDVELLEREGILVRVSPEEVLEKYEDPIAGAIRADLSDREFIALCEASGRAQAWRLALAKVPREIRDDPQHAEYAARKPRDRAMQRLMGELPRSLAGETLRYTEVYAETTHRLYDEQFVYDEYRETKGRKVEFRYADYPLPLGESIMVNHALFAGLLHANATPITDDPFHSQALSLKLRRATEIPVVQQAQAERARRHKINQLALAAVTDTQLNLPVLDPAFPLREVLEYRRKHDDALRQARDKMGWMARRIEAEPWSKDFANELEHKTIPDIAKELDKVREARDAWLESKRGRLALSATGIAVGAAAAVLSVFAVPLTPVALATAGLGLASGTAIPGVQWLLDWRDGKKTAQENGLHYLLKL